MGARRALAWVPQGQWWEGRYPRRQLLVVVLLVAVAVTAPRTLPCWGSFPA